MRYVGTRKRGDGSKLLLIGANQKLAFMVDVCACQRLTLNHASIVLFSERRVR
jgi:hypothetical protein